MKKALVGIGALVCLLAFGAGQARAVDRGPILANNILGGASAGALAGLAAGTLAYGLDNNYNPEYLLSGAVWGVVGGAVLGSGIAVYEIQTNRQDTGFTVASYLAGGTGIGSLLGLVVATIPYMRDKDPEDFTIGLGLGGLLGATLGLTAAVIDINARDAGGDVLLSGEVGVLEVSARRALDAPDAMGVPAWYCRMAEFRY